MIRSLTEIKDFYFNVRKIKGKHKIENVLFKENCVAVRGVFNGTDGEGDTLKLSFFDFFRIIDLKIVERHTYFEKGFDKSI